MNCKHLAMENADGSKVEAKGFGFSMFRKGENGGICHIPIQVCIKCGSLFGDIGVIDNEPLTPSEEKHGAELAKKHDLDKPNPYDLHEMSKLLKRRRRG